MKIGYFFDQLVFFFNITVRNVQRSIFFIDLKYLLNVAEYHIRFGRKKEGRDLLLVVN